MQPYPSKVVCIRMNDDPTADDAVEAIQGDLSVRQLKPGNICRFKRKFDPSFYTADQNSFKGIGSYKKEILMAKSTCATILQHALLQK